MSFPWANEYKPQHPVMQWVDERLPLPRFVYNAIGGGYPVPRNLNHFWNFGVLAGLALRGFSLWRAPSGVLVTPPRLSSSQPFLRTSRLAPPGLGDKALMVAFDAVLAAHSQNSRTTPKAGR